MTTITFPQQNNMAVNQQHIKVSANGSVSGSQIIHIQPIVTQQGQQFYLQQNPGEPPIQLLLQGPNPVVGSLVPMLQKMSGQTTTTTLTLPVHKITATQAPVAMAVTKAVPSPVRLLKTTPTATLPVVKSPTNGKTVAMKCPAKAPVAVAAPKAVVAPKVVATPKAATAAGATPAAAAAAAVVSTRPAPTLPPPAKEKAKKSKSREKKPLKVQTRSGRVSRPPKYKAKDYKFIKNEDLAESHPSDSDDYSEMSVEEEGEEGREGTPSSGSGHKSKAFQCKSCDKAYIGHGGLNRHFKLNPTHGVPVPLPGTAQAAAAAPAGSTAKEPPAPRPAGKKEVEEEDGDSLAKEEGKGEEKKKEKEDEDEEEDADDSSVKVRSTFCLSAPPSVFLLHLLLSVCSTFCLSAPPSALSLLSNS